MSGRIATVLLLVWEMRSLIPFPDDLTTPEGLGDALTRILGVLEKAADLTETTYDDKIVEFLQQYAEDESFLKAAASVLAFLLDKKDEAERVGEPFDARAALAAQVEEKVEAGEFHTVAA